MDNIQLDSGEKLSFSYRVKYQQPASAISIDVDDQDLLKEGKQKDTYPDIGISTTDACQKSRRIFFNDKTGNKRSYEQLFDDINKEMSDYDS